MILYFTFTSFLFLIILNGFLRGKLKHKADTILGGLIILVIIYTIYSDGWFALIYVALIWLIVGNFILTPLAKRVARVLLKN